MCRKSRDGKNTAKPMRNVTHTGKQPGRRRSPKEKEHTSRSRMTSSPPPPPIPSPKRPHRVQRQMQVEAGMCRKSRDGKNTAKTDAKCDAHRKTPKKTMRNGQLSRILDSAARRLLYFFARKHRKYRCEKKTQVQFRASKVAKTRVSAHASTKPTHPARRHARAANNNNNNKKVQTRNAAPPRILQGFHWGFTSVYNWLQNGVNRLEKGFHGCIKVLQGFLWIWNV